MIKKIGKVICSLVIVGFIGTNVVQAAGASLAQVSVKTPNPVGAKITVKSKLGTASQNYGGKATFTAYSKKEKFGVDQTIASSVMRPGDELDVTNSVVNGTYYAMAKYHSGGSAYLSGYVSASSKK